MKTKRSIEIETLTDIQIAVCNAVQTTEDSKGHLSESDCICIHLHGYFAQKDEEIEVPAFISVENAKELADILIELTAD